MKFVGNGRGVIQVMQSPEMARKIDQVAAQKVGAAGDGFVASGRVGKTRYRSIIYADSWSAKNREHRDNVLIRVLNS